MKIELDEYCPSCDYNTFKKSERLQYSICPICFWEDDPIQFEEPDCKSGANRVSLIQARKNFIEFGSCEKDMIKNCRKPNKKDIKKPLVNG
ncbi:CPCC family cysteine-rich protein [Spongiimicrobium salis]|uniref:CPCC family cysteine-rich protein n=1 Tax=Spongiimicrobium salis TaxID=1667022 RepID=UPI00374D37A1